MITWLASYPRSGNTFFRIVLDRVFGISSQSLYANNDGVDNLLGRKFVGADSQILNEIELVESECNLIVKTHSCKNNGFASIYLVRDGRDSLVSYAYHELRMQGFRRDSKNWQREFDLKLVELMNRNSNAGNWGSNVCSWLDHHESSNLCNTLVRYEDLIANPDAVVSAALDAVGYKYNKICGVQAPEFNELQLQDAQFFRRGTTGQYLEYMSADLQQMFWSKSEMKRAMERLKY